MKNAPIYFVEKEVCLPTREIRDACDPHHTATEIENNNHTDPALKLRERRLLYRKRRKISNASTQTHFAHVLALHVIGEPLAIVPSMSSLRLHAQRPPPTFF